jgi:hypothetical protein
MTRNFKDAGTIASIASHFEGKKEAETRKHASATEKN